MSVESVIGRGISGDKVFHRLYGSVSALAKTPTARLLSTGWGWMSLARRAGHGRRAGERAVLLGVLRRELVRLGVRARVVHGVGGPACLWLRGESGRTERVLCLGAGGTYTFVTECGRLVGVADEIGEAARALVWLVDPPVTLNTAVGR